jgi:hypothetical protein
MSKRSRQLVVIAGLAALLLAFGPTSFAKPPGNNGMVKVDSTPFDDKPNNEPHVGCTFEIDFYGYEAGDLTATVTFEGIAPTGGGMLASDSVAIGQDPAGGGTDLDASRTYDLSAPLSSVQPHARQGYHVKLTVRADGSIGSDVKHKVFWVQACGGTGEEPPPGGEEPPGGGEPPGGSTPPGPNVPPATPANPVTGNPGFTG